ncbi:MAG: YhjD/YihY/BrkB family envelope integrity protein [Syntrophales bacterium]|nr:YhjD/YihY/BrkB family envelope integrity protein [Syntrophales bacterium]
MISRNNQESHQSESSPVRVYFILATVWDILRNAVKNYRNNGDMNQAAAIALYAILSIIPLFILTIVVGGHIFGSYPNMQNELVKVIREFHPYFSEALLTQLGRVEQKKQLLGWIGILSLVWLSTMIFSAIETALNNTFRAKAARNYFVSKLLAIAMIPMGWAIGIVSVGITYLATILAKQPVMVKGGYLSLAHGTLFRYILPYLLIVVFVTIVYKVVPRGKVAFGGALLGGAIFSALTEIAKHFFTWYVSNYTRYHVIFGSLETVVVLVIWVFYVAVIFLFCAELISSCQKRDLVLLEKAFLKSEKKLTKVDERIFLRFGCVYPKGTYIFREGDTDQEMYYILRGKVQMEKKAGQVRKLLAEMGPGEYFGEMAALIDAPRTASARTMEDSQVAVIDGNTFRNILRESEGVSLHMLKEFSNRIRKTNVSLEEITRLWIKLVVILYFLKNWPLKTKQNPLDELARFTGKEPGEIREILNGLSNQGVLIMENGSVTRFIKEEAWNLLGREVPLDTLDSLEI